MAHKPFRNGPPAVTIVRFPDASGGGEAAPAVWNLEGDAARRIALLFPVTDAADMLVGRAAATFAAAFPSGATARVGGRPARFRATVGDTVYAVTISGGDEVATAAYAAVATLAPSVAEKRYAPRPLRVGAAHRGVTAVHYRDGHKVPIILPSDLARRGRPEPAGRLRLKVRSPRELEEPPAPLVVERRGLIRKAIATSIPPSCYQLVGRERVRPAELAAQMVAARKAATTRGGKND